MDFSPDGRYLAVQGGSPDWPLALWLWEKSKLCGMYRPAQVHTSSSACYMRKDYSWHRTAAGLSSRQMQQSHT
jgi:hypothetical protein